MNHTMNRRDFLKLALTAAGTAALAGQPILRRALAHPNDEGWQQPPVQNPPPARYGHAMFAFGGNAYLFGGMVEQSGAAPANAPMAQIPANDMWVFDRLGLRWTEIASTNTPSPRSLMSATAQGSKMYLFGGVDTSNNVLGELWVYEARISGWEQLTGGPPARKLHASVTLESYGEIVVLGGLDQNNTPLNDVWLYNIESDSWTQGPDYPGGNDLYDVPVVASGDRVHAFVKEEDLWAFDRVALQWAEIAMPTPNPPLRRGAAYTSSGNKAWIIGGQEVASGNVLNDTWEYDFETGSWVQRENMPMSLMQLVATYVYIQPTRARTLTTDESFVLVFGGKDQSGQPQGTTLFFTPPSEHKIYLPLIMRQ